jgi:ribosomal protein S18 acetylase RimI-like enzyme
VPPAVEDQPSGGPPSGTHRAVYREAVTELPSRSPEPSSGSPASPRTSPSGDRPPAADAPEAGPGTGPAGRTGAAPAPAQHPSHADPLVVEEATEVTDQLVAGLRRLVPQLSSSAPPVTRSEVAAIVASPATVLLVARRGADIVGSLTLATFRLPTGVRAWIEDVVVDEAARGTGVGGQLTMAAVERARRAGARTVDLTSRPSRQAANRLYQRLGFTARDTNVYRYTIEDQPTDR